jgi:hypothetical protein
LGNIYFAYSYIDIGSQAFKDWVDLVDPIVSFMGVDSGDPIGHKRFLAIFAGGMLPIISLSFLHMLVKFEEDERQKEIEIQVEQITKTESPITPKEVTPQEVLNQETEDKPEYKVLSYTKNVNSQ